MEGEAFMQERGKGGRKGRGGGGGEGEKEGREGVSEKEGGRE
jgi:hypothetical protein